MMNLNGCKMRQKYFGEKFQELLHNFCIQVCIMHNMQTNVGISFMSMNF